MDSLILVGQFFVDHKASIVGALLAVSEVLSFIPSIKANGIVQLIIGALLKLKGPVA